MRLWHASTLRRVPEVLDAVQTREKRAHGRWAVEGRDGPGERRLAALTLRGGSSSSGCVDAFSFKDFHKRALDMGGVGLDTLRSALLPR